MTIAVQAANISAQPELRLLVVTPTLGISPFLTETVRSVRELGAEVEHVVVAPATRVQDLQSQYPDVRVVPEPGQRGMYGALNEGVRMARSDWNWFTYLNDDDTLECDASSRAFMESLPSGMSAVAYGRCMALAITGRPMFAINIARTPADLANLLHWRIVPLTQQGLFFNAAAWRHLGEFDEAITHGADLDYIVRALNAYIPFQYLHGITGGFRIRPGQLSKNSTQMRKDLDLALNKLKAGRRAWPSLLRYRIQGLPAVLARITSMGLRRTRSIYEATN